MAYTEGDIFAFETLLAQAEKQADYYRAELAKARDELGEAPKEEVKAAPKKSRRKATTKK